MSDRKKYIFAAILIIFYLFSVIISAIIAFLLGRAAAMPFPITTPSTINSYAECAVAGYPVTAIYPATCTTPDGRTFTDTVEMPSPDPLPPSPIVIPAKQTLTKMTLEQKCNQVLLGIWYGAEKKCRQTQTNFSENDCQALGGQFQECGSLCDLTANPSITCIEMCINVCSF